jgi:FkbM family methyltransferase
VSRPQGSEELLRNLAGRPQHAECESEVVLRDAHGLERLRLFLLNLFFPVKIARKIAASLPQSVIARLNHAQFAHPHVGRVLRILASHVASGEGTIANGPAAGIRIDATGRQAGYVLGTSDVDEQRWMVAHLKPGNVFWDVGANIGFFTLLARRLIGEAGEVVAFEPLPENVHQLRHNLELNGFADVRVEEAAVSAESGKQLFSAPMGKRRYAGSLVHTGNGDGSSSIVNVISLDDYLTSARPRAPDIIKLDVEGAEIDAMRGARGLIESFRPTMLVEVHWLGSAFVDFFERELAPLGYRPLDLADEPLAELRRENVRFHVVLDA